MTTASSRRARRSAPWVTHFAALALSSAVALPAFASSMAASSASEGASASVGSISNSFETSSDSSTDKKTAAGDYQVIDVAAAAGRPGMLRMKLQPLGEGAAKEAFVLYLPEQALAQNPIATGQIVSAKPRPYGTEFARADTGRAFFLVLQDEWHRELQSQAVVL